MKSQIDNSTLTNIYEGLLDNNFSKISTTCISFLTIILTSPFLLGIIWYERNGRDIQRTLIDRLSSSSCIHLLIIYLFHQLPYIIVFTLNYSFNPITCAVQALLGNVLLSHAMVQINLILLVRFVYIFVLKNPGLIDDSFFHCFLIMTSLVGCCIIHGVNAILPGRWPTFYYICTGTDFRNSLPPKFGWTHVSKRECLFRSFHIVAAWPRSCVASKKIGQRTFVAPPQKKT